MILSMMLLRSDGEFLQASTQIPDQRPASRRARARLNVEVAAAFQELHEQLTELPAAADA